jgi:hypothetical protein
MNNKSRLCKRVSSVPHGKYFVSHIGLIHGAVSELPEDSLEISSELCLIKPWNGLRYLYNGISFDIK